MFYTQRSKKRGTSQTPAWEGTVATQATKNLKVEITDNGGFALKPIMGMGSIYTSNARLSEQDAEYTSTLMDFIKREGGDVTLFGSQIRTWLKERRSNGPL